jgi:DNA polymerase III delta prime subunit
MQLIIDTYKNTGALHHAYCICGERGAILPSLYDFLTDSFGFPIQANPDFMLIETDSFGIDESRMIQEIHNRKSFEEAGRKVSVIAANTLTREAQNALLKIFEEPAAGNHFFIVTNSSDNLLPTLRSRLIIIESEANKSQHESQAKKFLMSSIPERLAIVKSLVDEINDEEKTKTDAIAFVHSIEQSLVAKLNLSKATKEDIFKLEELSKCASYLRDRSPSVKQLLEHVALIV